MTRDEMLRDLDSAIKAGDLELSRAIEGKLNGAAEAPKPAPAGPAGAPQLDPAVEIAQNPLTRFAVGAGKGVVGAGQFLANNFPPMRALKGTGIPEAYNKHVFDPLTASISRTEEMGKLPEGGWNVAGFGGEMLSPTGLAAGKILSGAPKLGQKIAQGTAFGSVMGASQPMADGTDEGTKLGQVAGGAAVGGILPGITGAAAKFIGRPVSEFFTYVLGTGGAAKLATRHTNEVVGPENVQKLVAEIQSQMPGTGGGLVRGYQPTTGEMVAHMPESTGWQAIQNVAARSPQGSVGMGLRQAEQRAAIEGAMAPIAGTEAQLAAAEATRKAAANAAYAEAAKTPIKADEALVEISRNPYFAGAVPKAMEMAKASGQTDTTSILHNIKVILDQQLGKTGNEAVNRTERKLIGDVQRDLVSWMEKANPAYAAARKGFQEASVPINRMQVGQELESKMFAPTDQMTPGAYLRALDDAPKLIKDATGKPRGSLDQVFDPAQASTLREVGGLMERKLAQQKPLQPTSIGSGDSGVKLELPHMLSTPIVLINWVLRTISGGSGGLEAGVQKINAARALYPDKFVEGMKLLPPSKRAEIMSLLERQGVTPMNQGLIAPTAQGLFDSQTQ